MSQGPVASEQRDQTAAGVSAVHDPTVDDELELVSRLVAAVARLTRPLTDDELDAILLS